MSIWKGKHILIEFTPMVAKCKGVVAKQTPSILNQGVRLQMKQTVLKAYKQ